MTRLIFQDINGDYVFVGILNSSDMAFSHYFGHPTQNYIIKINKKSYPVSKETFEILNQYWKTGQIDSEKKEEKKYKKPSDFKWGKNPVDYGFVIEEIYDIGLLSGGSEYCLYSVETIKKPQDDSTTEGILAVHVPSKETEIEFSHNDFNEDAIIALYNLRKKLIKER